MNEVMANIRTRRSVRKFQSRMPSKAEIDMIVEAGIWAPSARNTQPWHLTVIMGLDRIAAVTAELKAAVERMPENPYKAFVGNDAYTASYHAPVFIIVSADSEAAPLAAADCALVLGNMFLAAHSLGIGSCWINQLGSACPDPGFRKMLTELGVPEANQIFGCGAFGYAEGPAPLPPARKEHTVNYVE